MTSNGTTYFLTSATTTSAQQNSYMEDFNDAEQDWFLDEDQQAQPVGTPTGDDFSALFNVPIDDTFFGEATSGLDVQNIAPDPQTDQFSQGSSVVVQPGQAPYQPYGSEAGPSGYSQPPLQQMQNQQFETLQPYDPCQPAAPQGQYNPSGQQLQQPYTSSTNLNHTSSTEFDLSAAAELAAAFENQRSDGLPSYERPMQSGTYVPECQPSTSSANQFGHAGKQQGWMGGVQGMEMAGGMAVSHQQYGQASGYRIVQREDGQQIAYVDQQQEMLTEMGGQYVNAAAQNEGGYNPVQVMHPHTNSTNMPPHILQQNQNQPSFHSMPPQTLISGSQPPPQLMSNGPDMLSNPNNASNQARRMPAPKTAAKKAAPARQAPNSTTSSFASATLGSVMEKIFANTGDMNAAVRFTPEKSAEFGQILCQYNSLMAEQEATGMDLSMQIKSVEERIVALLSVAEPTSQTTMAQPFPSTAQPNPCIPPQTQTTSKPPAKSKWRKKPPQAKQDPPPTTPTPSKPFNAPPRQQEIAAIIQMDPNNMTSLTPQQLAQLLPGHLTTGANGQPVTVLLDYGPAGQQQIQLQTLPVTPVLEPSRKAPAKKPQSGKNGMDGTLDDTIDQVVGHQQPLYVYNPPNGTPAENSTTAAVKVPPKRKSRAKAAIAQAKNSGQLINVRPITPPPPPVILPSPAELGKKIEARRIRRKENVSKEFDILLDSLAEEDCEKPFTSKSDCIQRVLPFAFSYEPEMSKNLLEQFDHEMLRHSVSIMERRNELETKMRSILFRDALGKDAYNHELSMLLHLDCEYERRTLTKEKELAANDPSSFVPDPYLLQSATNPVASEENHKLPSTSSMQASENTKIASPVAPTAMDFDYHDFDPQDYLNRIFNLVLPASPKTPSPLPSSEDEEEILPIQDPELQTSSQREENKDSVDPPTEMASPLQENDPQPILETHYMKSPELFTNFNLRSPVHEPEEVVKWQEESAQEVFRNIDQGQNHNLVGINQVFGRPEAVENGTFEASTSQNWSFEHNSLSHLPPKLRLTRARLQLPLVQALDNGIRSLNEGEKLKPLEQTVGSSLEMSTALSNDAGKERKFDLESTEGDGADENLRGLVQQIAEQVVERKLEEVEEKAQDQQECKLQPLKIKLNRNPVKSPLTLSNNTAQLPEKESKEDRKRRKKEEKREKKRLKHLQKSTSDAQESYQSPEKTSVNSISSPPAPIVSLIPASPPLTSPIPSPIKRRRPCWESGSNTNASSPPKLPAMPRKLSPPVKVPVNGLKLRISKVLLSSKTRKKRHREVALPKEPVDLVHEAVFLPEEPADLPMEQVPLPEEPVNIASDPVVELENGKHHHRSNGSKKKKKREHRKREEIMEEVLPVTRREEEKPTQSLKIPKLKIKMMHKEGASTSSSSEVLPINNNHHHQRQSTSSSTQDSNLTLKIRPLKPPSSKSPKKVSPKNHALSENRPMAQNPYTNSLTSAFQMEVNPLCAPLLNGNHALFGLPAAQMKQNCGSIRAEAPHSPAFGGLSTGLNASRERVQFSPCDDDPEDDRLRSQTSQLLTKLM